MWVTDMKFQMENWTNISKNCNLVLDDEEDNIDYNELNKHYLNQSIKIPKSKTFPRPMRNLPDDEQLVNRLLDYENKEIAYTPWQIEKMFRNMPFKWLSKVCNRFCGDRDVLIVDYPDDLPQSIKKYVQKFYAKHYNSAGFGHYISANKNSIVNETLGFKDFLAYFESIDSNFSRFEESSINFCADSVYLFDGIAIENFYNLYFKSGLSKEVILRFLKDDEYAYSIDHQAIEKQVERILSKH